MKLFLFENQIISIILIIFILAIWLFSIQCAWSLGRQYGYEEFRSKMRAKRKAKKIQNQYTYTESETVRVVGKHEPKNNSEIVANAN